MTEATEPNGLARDEGKARGDHRHAPDGAAVRPGADTFKSVILIYGKGSALAIVVVLLLVLAGLNFTAQQWICLGVGVTVLVPVYVAVDVWVIKQQLKPVERFFDALAAAGAAEREVAAGAVVRLLNLPYLTALRMFVVHGPGATLSGLVTLFLSGELVGVTFETWQYVFLAAVIMLFATPAHAIFEFFAVSEFIETPLQTVWQHCPSLQPEDSKKLFLLRIRHKLIAMITSVSALPALFLAFTLIFKIDVMASNDGGGAMLDRSFELYIWVFAVTAICFVAAVWISNQAAAEVSRFTNRILSAMQRVESGDLDHNLVVASTDEYMDLYRGFNRMTEGLKQEVQFLEVTKDLSGEIHLDLLLERLMTAASELLDAERSTVFLHDPGSDELWSRFGIGIAAKEIRFPASEGIAGHVFHSGQVCQVEDPYSDPRFNPKVDQRTGFETRNILCMPIVDKSGERIGVTQVLNKHNGAFKDHDVKRLEAFTAQVAVSLQNARLFDEVLRVKNYNENILKSSSDGIVTVDTEGLVVKLNEAASGIFGTAAGAQQLTIEGMLAPESRWIRASADAVMSSGRPDYSADAEVFTAPGQKISANLKIEPLRDAESEIIGALLAFEDISSEKRVKTTMSRYLSKEVVDELLAGGLDALGGQHKTVSVLFSDIRSFTSLAEGLSAVETVEMLNQYFTEMVDVVFARDGVLDKFIGDAIMALFGAPFSKPQDADNAVAAAVEMTRQLSLLNVARRDAGKPPISIGIGVVTGSVVVGNIGSPKRMEYTVIGDAVNLASRIEGATKYYGVEVMISESTRDAIGDDFVLRELDLVRVKGKEQPIRIYEVLEGPGAPGSATRDACLAAYAEGLRLYREQRWTGAEAQFNETLAQVPDDRPAQLLLERCRHFAAAPPPADWDGVWQLTEK